MTSGHRLHAAGHDRSRDRRRKNTDRSTDHHTVFAVFECQEIHKREQHRKNTADPCCQLAFRDRQVTDHLAALPVHGKLVSFALPVGAQKPDRQHAVFRSLRLDLLTVPSDFDVVVIANSAGHRCFERVDSPVVRALSALLFGDVVFVGHKAGHILHRERPQLPVVKRLDGIHEIVGHPGRGIDRDLLKSHLPLSVNVKIFTPHDLFIAGTASVFFIGVIFRLSFHFSGVQPERDIDTLDLFDVMIRCERRRKKLSSFIVVLERADRLLFVHFEGDDEVRPVHAGELPGNDSGISAIRAARGRRCFIADKFSAAGRAVVSAHVRRFASPAAVSSCTRARAGSIGTESACPGSAGPRKRARPGSRAVKCGTRAGSRARTKTGRARP